MNKQSEGNKTNQIINGIPEQLKLTEPTQNELVLCWACEDAKGSDRFNGLCMRSMGMALETEINANLQEQHEMSHLLTNICSGYYPELKPIQLKRVFKYSQARTVLMKQPAWWSESKLTKEFPYYKSTIKQLRLVISRLVSAQNAHLNEAFIFNTKVKING